MYLTLFVNGQFQKQWPLKWPEATGKTPVELRFQTREKYLQVALQKAKVEAAELISGNPYDFQLSIRASVQPDDVSDKLPTAMRLHTAHKKEAPVFAFSRRPDYMEL